MTTTTQGTLNRRAFLKQLTAAIGSVAAANVMAGDKLSMALAFHNHESSGAGNNLFNESQRAVLFALSDAVLPKTDTPSATELNCHNFIEHQLQHCYSEEQQRASKSILDKLDSKANGKFAALTLDERQTLLRKLESQDGFTKQDKGQFSLVKYLLVFGYFTSQVGATEALDYLAVPGGYKGSLPLKEDTKAWGSLTYY